MKLAKRTFNREFKLTVCHEIESGLKTQAQVSREHMIGSNLISQWIQRYRKDPVNCFSSNQKHSLDAQAVQIKELERILGRVTYENQVLREANSLLKKIQLERRFTK